jgi:hypothetical protein
MIRYDFAQRSEDWQRARLGIPTSSEFHRIVTPKECKLSAQSRDYMAVLLAEWMLAAPLPSIETEYMQRGAQLEHEAVRAYEFASGLDTETVGFVTTDDGMIGCSPDRLVGSEGCLEIKCPAANTHVGYMLERKLDDKYAPQTQGQLFITGRQWVDTVSYYPGLPTVVIRSGRRPDYIASLQSALSAFVETMLVARATIIQKYGEFPIAKPKPNPDDLGPLGVSDEDARRIWEAYVASRD